MSPSAIPAASTPSSGVPDRLAPEAAGGTAEAVSFLLTHGLDTRRESRRIVVGSVALLVLALLAVNVAIYQKAESKLVEQGWQRLATTTEAKRDQIRRVVDTYRREARSVAEDPDVRANVSRLAAGVQSAGERDRLSWKLQTAVHTFAFENVQLVDVDGRVLWELHGGDATEQARDLELAARCTTTGEEVLGDFHGSHLTFAAPVGASDADGRTPAMLFHAEALADLDQALTNWPGFGATAGSYLVRSDGERVLYLTTLANDPAVLAGNREPLSSQASIAASMAATGVESNVETTNGLQHAIWATTRRMPEMEWGIVGQVERAAMLRDMRGTLAALLLIDFAIAVAALGMTLLWRRHYRSGLAQREVEITERHAHRVQAIFDTAFDAILTFDRQGRVRTVNHAAEAMFGRAAGELDGQPMQRFLHWGENGRGGALPASGTVVIGEAMRPDGTRVPVEFSMGHAGEGNELVHTAIVRDISERVESESRIRSFADGLEMSNRRLEEVNAQLEEASRLKSEFLANTSHELRTPLNGMIGFLQLVLDGMCENPEEEREFLRQALHCSRHLLGLINDVLDIAKIEAGKLTLEVESVDVQQLFDEVYTVTHVQAAQKGVELRFEHDLEPGVHARGDFGKIKQVLINLVGNSLKFTPKGSITVRAHSHRELGHLMFEVVDTGIGIPADRQKLVFEKFVQADGSTTRRFGGTGLGLAISRSLIEIMGGIIGVQSDGPGRGTRMYFSLPVWRGETEETPRESAEPSDRIDGPAGGPLVLVVEDDGVFRRFLTAVLQQSGYRTVEANHAEAGWVIARRLRPSVVVLDYALSCGDGANLRTGWDLAERMTTEAQTRHIPVVFVTGFDGELKEKLHSTAFSRRPEHLVKPIEAKVLVEKISQLAGDAGSRVLRILMADDDPSVAAYVRKVLPEHRFHVEVANNGEECLHILRTQPNGFDLLLLDLMMPQVSGYDVLREMTLTGIRPDLPVLVLTNFPEARNEEERLLLEQGLVLDVVAKTAVHDNPKLLPHVLDWHLQAAAEVHDSDGAAAAKEDDDLPQREAA